MPGHGPVAGLHHPGDGLLHRLPAHVKVLATLMYIVAVVATPAHVVWAFGGHAVLLVAVAILAGLPARLVLRRLRIEVPFLAFAVFLPLVGGAPHVEVLGVALSEAGLWAGWEIIAKGTLGVGATVVLGATTPVPELLRGVERLRVPRLLTAIGGFMVRYLEVVLGEASRMRIARASRGHDPRWLWQARAIASSSGTLFVRSYERGERVHLAMLSRGYTGSLPVLHEHAPVPRAWAAASVVPLAALAVMVAARVGGA
ncbi:MAG: cobalt ECF transporter T component CbiQ [Acidimicrobiales bacterium]